MRWYSAIVADNADPDRRGRLRLRIPGLLGDAVAPDWIVPSLPGGSAPGAVGVFWVPPVDSIVVALVDGPSFRWTGGEISGTASLPDELRTNYPARAGMTDPAGRAKLVLEDADVGAGLLVPRGRMVAIGDLAARIAAVKEPELREWATDVTLWLLGHKHIDPLSGFTGVPDTSPPTPPDFASATLMLRD